MNVSIKDKLYTQIRDYCSINDLPIGEYINGLLQKSFMVDKYGDKPAVLKTAHEKIDESPEPIAVEVYVAPELKEVPVVIAKENPFEEPIAEKPKKTTRKPRAKKIEEKDVEYVQVNEPPNNVQVETEPVEENAEQPKPRKRKLK